MVCTFSGTVTINVPAHFRIRTHRSSAYETAPPTLWLVVPSPEHPEAQGVALQVDLPSV